MMMMNTEESKMTTVAAMSVRAMARAYALVARQQAEVKPSNPTDGPAVDTLAAVPVRDLCLRFEGRQGPVEARAAAAVPAQRTRLGETYFGVFGGSIFGARAPVRVEMAEEEMVEEEARGDGVDDDVDDDVEEALSLVVEEDTTASADEAGGRAEEEDGDDVENLKQDADEEEESDAAAGERASGCESPAAAVELAEVVELVKNAIVAAASAAWKTIRAGYDYGYGLGNDSTTVVEKDGDSDATTSETETDDESSSASDTDVMQHGELAGERDCDCDDESVSDDDDGTTMATVPTTTDLTTTVLTATPSALALALAVSATRWTRAEAEPSAGKWTWTWPTTPVSVSVQHAIVRRVWATKYAPQNDLLVAWNLGHWLVMQCRVRQLQLVSEHMLQMINAGDAGAVAMRQRRLLAGITEERGPMAIASEDDQEEDQEEDVVVAAALDAEEAVDDGDHDHDQGEDEDEDEAQDEAEDGDRAQAADPAHVQDHHDVEGGIVHDNDDEAQAEVEAAPALDPVLAAAAARAPIDHIYQNGRAFRRRIDRNQSSRFMLYEEASSSYHDRVAATRQRLIERKEKASRQPTAWRR